MNYYFQCPKCGNDKQFAKPSEEASNLGCFLFFLGGFLPCLLVADHNLRRVQCGNCAHLFQQPPMPNSPVAKFAGWISALTLIPIIVAVAVFAGADSPDVLPSVPVIAFLEEAIAVQPRVAAYLLILLPAVILFACLIAACISNVLYRKRFATVHRVKPAISHSTPGQHSLQPQSPNESLNA